jgi:GH15 family glucan-1,4-alpha-glucosidase
VIQPQKQPAIQEYAIIGDCRAAALVSKKGSIDWLCWPLFDSSAIFSALLDPQKGGYWSIRPAVPCRIERSYLENSNVLQTRFVTSDGCSTLTDLMPVASEAFKRENLVPDHELVRQLECTAGEMRVEVEFRPRADYGRRNLTVRELGKLGLRIDVGRGAYWLRSNIKMRPDSEGASASIALKQGDRIQFSLSYSEESPTVLPALGDTMVAGIERSVRWWQQWTARARYDGPYREEVLRSALVLKLLAYAPSGAIVASPTTSLPERIGGGLNWDYRYCWLRDASLTIRAMLGLGYIDEAESFLTWMLHATQMTQPQLRVLYDVFGRIAPWEKELDHLAGYRDSRPVRIGNGARQQFQLDIYGEVIDATAQYAQFTGRFDRTTQKVLIGFGKYVAQNWDRPDAGIWEPRSSRVNHTYSRLMCWTALDRLLALSEKGMLAGVPREWFLSERDRIRRQLESRGWNQSLRSYVSVLDGSEVDAALLRISWYGFAPANSERMQDTYHRICEKLGTNGLLFRYPSQPGEGAFGICSFWAVEHLAIGGGTRDQAHHAFRRLLKYQNDVGLFAEEIDPQTGDALGNFPQAFTHVGLISAAFSLQERDRQEPHPAAETGGDIRTSKQEARA